MKKRWILGLLFVSAFVFIGMKWDLPNTFLLNEHLGKVFAQSAEDEPLVVQREFEKVLTLQHEQPIYMKTERFIQIGELQADQSVAIIEEDEDYYELRFGKMNVYVRKAEGTIEKKKIPTLTQMKRYGAMKTFQTTTVHEKADSQSAVLLKLEENYRFPILHEEEDWYIIELGGRPGYIQKHSVELDKGLPVLVYHHMVPRDLMKSAASTVSVEAFDEQMAYLNDEQFKSLSAQQLYDYLEGRLVLPDKMVLITFDDGLLSAKEYAYPILKKYGFTAPHHIITSRTHKAEGAQQFDAEGPIQYLTMSDLKEMQDVFQFEAHTDDLHTLTDRKYGVGLALQRDEIRADLQANLAQLPNAVALAYPYGQYNEEFIAAAKDAGLLIGFTIIEGYANMNDSNYEVRRFGMTENRSFEQFAKYVDGNTSWQ
ncbi:polysaccharide deacetylase family protein [Sporosarcina sp. Sa2YVA2]|uniref:Polysaccharide deacetylase family protein n=1 Tax=Sporosarcina quadrami TaxID=2762234 RepID=A0ABR8UAT8_9BACL|nr:polysaccharide deacetylase family protein [Sporosarcina quadrami]MBD7984930.1 polysaccharide deacetylase family protein [Sporosarcina quadrami]